MNKQLSDQSLILIQLSNNISFYTCFKQLDIFINASSVLSKYGHVQLYACMLFTQQQSVLWYHNKMNQLKHVRYMDSEHVTLMDKISKCEN